MDECLHSCKNAGCMTTSLCGWLCSLSLCERINQRVFLAAGVCPIQDERVGPRDDSRKPLAALRIECQCCISEAELGKFTPDGKVQSSRLEAQGSR